MEAAARQVGEAAGSWLPGLGRPGTEPLAPPNAIGTQNPACSILPLVATSHHTTRHHQHTHTPHHHHRCLLHTGLLHSSSSPAHILPGSTQHAAPPHLCMSPDEAPACARMAPTACSPKAAPSRGPRLMRVRARRRAGACRWRPEAPATALRPPAR